MIVEAQRNMHDDDSFSFPGISDPAMSTPFTQFGSLKKIVIAARFNVHVPDGWPELQIMRMADGGISSVEFTTNAMEPKPTGYLNLYEYNLTATNFTIQVRDTLNIAWRGNVQQPRFSLAYNGPSPAIPMVSIVVGNCDSVTNLLTLNSLYCEEDTEMATDSTPTGSELVTSTEINDSEGVSTPAKTSTTVTASTVTMITESTSTTQATSTNQNKSLITNDNNIKIISGVVAISLFLIILLIFLVVLTFVVKRRKKSASIYVTDPIEISAQP